VLHQFDHEFVFCILIVGIVGIVGSYQEPIKSQEWGSEARGDLSSLKAQWKQTRL
jgi:hypothetical protein